MLGGALLGLGLGALLSHLGLGGAMAGMLGSLLMVALLALAGFFIYRMIRSRSGNSGNSSNSNNNSNNSPFERTPQGAGNTPEIGSRLQPQAFEMPASGPALDKPGMEPLPASAPVSGQWGVPADFDEAAFLRHAKSNFIRLQAAWDKADANDIREFTTPEVFAELKMQIAERGAAPEYTDVVTIAAELLGIETTGSDYLASVKFNGTIKPAQDALPEPFAEVWNMSKPLSGNSGWVLAGIQQLNSN